MASEVYLLLTLSVVLSNSAVFGLKFDGMVSSKVGIFHTASGYWVDGSGKIGELTNTGKFIIKIEDETGCIYFTQGNKTFAPARGCAHESEVSLEDHDPLEITQRWSLNSDGTIGNACDPSTRLYINDAENKVELRKVGDCVGDEGGRIEFLTIDYE